MTLEELAITAQHEFESIRRDMATKEDLKTTEATILRAVEGVGRQMQAYDEHWSGHLEGLDDRFREIDNRVTFLERSNNPA